MIVTGAFGILRFLSLFSGVWPSAYSHEENAIEKPLVEQILDEMFAVIEVREEFDTPTIEKLKQLVKSGDLTKVKQVDKAIKLVPEGTS